MKKFLTGEVPIEDVVAEGSKAFTTSEEVKSLLASVSEFQVRDSSSLLAKNMPKLNEKCVLNDVNCYTVTPDYEHWVIKDKNKKVKLFHLDPWYDEKGIPKPQDAKALRSLIDAMSKPESVVLIWGRSQFLTEHWKPIFADGWHGSKVKWHVDPHILVVQRSRFRDRFTFNNRVLHSSHEDVMIITRGIEKPSRPNWSKATQLRYQAHSKPEVFQYTEAFKAKYQENGSPASVISVYPPLKKARLHDLQGKVLRSNAEKSLYINEFLLDLFTKEDDWVVDLFAGTASMGVACLKTKRFYNGFEVERDLHYCATLRLARALDVFERQIQSPRLVTAVGLVPAALQQVLLCLSSVFFQLCSTNVCAD
jgi:16S rRNA G966 N2-methylase RsmD